MAIRVGIMMRVRLSVCISCAGSARGEDIDDLKNEYRRKYGKPCREVNGRIVCVH